MPANSIFWNCPTYDDAGNRKQSCQMIDITVRFHGVSRRIVCALLNDASDHKMPIS